MLDDDIKERIAWYIECKETLEKVQNLYRKWLDIGYGDDAYTELLNNYHSAYSNLKSILQE